VADTKLVHLVKGFPALGRYIKEVDFAVSVCVFTTDQENFGVGNGKCAAGPKSVLHSYAKACPKVLFYLVHFNTVINFLLCATIETTKSINALITNRTGTEIMPFIFHRSYLVPFVFSNIVFFC
jgi:hypothetical protein